MKKLLIIFTITICFLTFNCQKMCKHKWIKQEEYIVESSLNLAIKQGIEPKRYLIGYGYISIVYECKHCNRLKVLKFKN